MQIHCCGCQGAVTARLTNGAEVYPRRPDLSEVPVWKCDACQNYVGCHSNEEKHLQPLGHIPTPAMRQARKKLHGVMDQIWRDGLLSRKLTYQAMSRKLGVGQFHAAETTSVDEIENATSAAQELLDELRQSAIDDCPFKSGLSHWQKKHANSNPASAPQPDPEPEPAKTSSEQLSLF